MPTKLMQVPGRSLADRSEAPVGEKCIAHQVAVIPLMSYEYYELVDNVTDIYPGSKSTPKWIP